MGLIGLADDALEPRPLWPDDDDDAWPLVCVAGCVDGGGGGGIGVAGA